MTQGLRLAQRTIFDLGFRYATLIMAVGASLVLGLLLARDISTLTLAVGLAGLAVLGITLHQPAYTAAVLVAVAWGHLGDVLIKFHGMPSVVKPTVALLALVVFARWIKRNPVPLVGDPATWWFGAYAVIVWVGLLHAPFPNRVSGPAFDVAKDFVVYLIIINLLTSRAGLERTVWLMMTVGAVLGGLSIYQEVTRTYENNYGGLAQMKTAFIANGVEERARSGGSIRDPNFYAQMMLVLVPLGLWGAMHGRTWRGKLVGALAAGAIMGGVVLSFSRGGYVGLLVAVVLFAVFVRANARAVAWIMVLLLALVMVAPPEFKARFLTLGELFNSPSGQVEDTSLRGRSSYIDVAIAMFADYPILGVGQGNYRALYPQYISELGGGVVATERDSHSLYLQVVTEHGMVGALIFLGLLIVVWDRLSRAQRMFAAADEARLAHLAAALRAGLAGYLVAALFLHDAFPIFLWLQVSLAVACYVLARRLTAQPAQPAQPA